MLPIMIPLRKTFDPEAIDDILSPYTRLSGYTALALTAPVAEDGMGAAEVDGIRLSRCEQVRVRGFCLLVVPVGEVAWAHGRRFRVRLSGFRAQNGLPFMPCRFTLRTTPRRERDPAYDDHDAQALEAAREGMVLLRNENGALPLAPDAALNCFGADQHRFRLSATGASRINPRWRPGFLRAVEEHSDFTVNAELTGFYRRPSAPVPDEAVMARAREMSDAALVFISRHSGEMQDNRPIPGQYLLTDDERAMLRAVRARFGRVVVILNVGYPIEMAWLREIPVDAVLYTGFAGMLGSYALVEILDGRVNPSGHLPDTWPWRWGDDPVSRNFPVLGADDPAMPEDAVGVRVYYEEDVYLGYRYFDTFGKEAAFCFGRGLSYTRFELVPAGLSGTDDAVYVDVDVKNAGARPGKAVVQLYAAGPRGRLEKPAHVLAGFEKTETLAPGETRRLRIAAHRRDFASYDAARGAYVLEAGKWRFFIGEDLEHLVPCGELETPEAIVRRAAPLGGPVEPIDTLTRARPEVAGGRSRIVPLGERFARKAPRAPFAPPPLKRGHGPRPDWPALRRDRARLEDFVARLPLYDLCRLNVCAGHRWMPWQDGAAGFTPRLRRWRMPSFTVLDANAGLNLVAPNIGFPASSVIAASFNREIARSVGRVIALESRERGVYQNLGPGMNLHRGQLCGRHPEYFSEDPLLTGEMAGWHGRGLEENGVGCCYKHLFCNNSELSRKGSHSVVSEQALRELYFRAFEIAFGIQKPSAVMTSYNALNGLYPAENAALLQGLVRGEWGFEGTIMSDWNAYATIDPIEMVKAGNCWITPGGRLRVWQLWRAARRGRVSRAVLEDNVKHLLGTLLRLEGNEEDAERR